MINSERRVYTPPLEPSFYRLPDEDEGPRHKLMVGAIMAIVVAAIGIVAWNTYGDFGAPPLIAPPSRDFKTMAAAPPPAAGEEPELFNAIEGASPPPLTTRAPSAEEPIAALAAPKAPPAPVALNAAEPGEQGGYLVQLGALRSADAAETEWRIFASRAPALAHAAHRDIQRADLGPQGTYYRLRAGYFDDARERRSPIAIAPRRKAKRAWWWCGDFGVRARRSPSRAG